MIDYARLMAQATMLRKHLGEDSESPVDIFALAQNIDGAANHPVLREIGANYGKTAAQIGLRFLTQRDIPVIPKTKRPARLKENMALFDFRLREEDMAVIRGLDRNDTLFPWTRAY